MRKQKRAQLRIMALSMLGLPAWVPAQAGPTPAGISQSRETAITRAIREVSPAVAGINVIKLQRRRQGYGPLFDDPFWANLFPEVYRRVESLGSGVVISSDGYVVTNAHVVEDAAEIVVTLPGGRRHDVVEIFTDRLTDIALLKLEASGLPSARLGDSDGLIIGEWVVALGNPLGLFDLGKQPTATAGIISGLHMDFGHQEPGRVYQDMVQTDASINPGNSGGPLVNAQGEVVAINSFIFTGGPYGGGSIGIGFAIPINRVREVIEELKTHGRVDRSFSTGLTVQAVDKHIRRYLDLPAVRGMLISGIEAGSAGEKAGLQIGDVILEAAGVVVNSKRDFVQVVESKLLKAGDKLSLKIWREGRTQRRSLQLGS